MTLDAPNFSRVWRHRHLSLAALVALGILLVGSALNAADKSEIEFDLPAQPLSAALEAYSGATGVVVLYNGALAIGRTSAEVKGALSPHEALSRMLKDSELIPQYTAEDAVIVLPAGQSPAIARRPLQIAYAALSQRNASERRYYALVQAIVGEVLCRSQMTKPGGYRLALQLWIDQSGAVRQPRLLASTGDRERDAAIVGSLERASIAEPPPARMAQPFTMVALPAASGGVVNCPGPALRDRRNG